MENRAQTITAAQIRMGRAALRWTLRDFAEAAGVNVNTLNRVEQGLPARSGTLSRIKATLRGGGIVFVDADADAGPGVRLARAEE